MTTKSGSYVADLMAYHNSKKAEPFQWGLNDCALYTADALVAMGCGDIAPEIRGKYKTETGAKRLLAKLNADGLPGVLDAKLERIEKPFVQRGDVVLFAGDLGPTLGVYFNGGIFSSGPNGSVYLDASYDKIQLVWRT